MRVRFVVGSELLFALELPAVLIVAAIVKELTWVAEPAVAGLLVVLADVRSVVPSAWTVNSFQVVQSNSQIQLLYAKQVEFKMNITLYSKRNTPNSHSHVSRSPHRSLSHEPAGSIGDRAVLFLIELLVSTLPAIYFVVRFFWLWYKYYEIRFKKLLFAYMQTKN